MTVSAANLDACSPACAPPIPSATTYRPSRGSTRKKSSLLLRTHPGSDAPKAWIISSPIIQTALRCLGIEHRFELPVGSLLVIRLQPFQVLQASIFGPQRAQTLLLQTAI